MNTINQHIAVANSDTDEALLIGGSLGVIYRVVGDSVAVVEHTLPPKALAAPLHRHQHEDEVSYVLQGQIAVLQNNEVTTGGPGAYIAKPRGVFHTFWNPGTETAHILEIIAPGGFENYFRELAKLVPADASPDVEGIMALAGRYGLEFDMGSLPMLFDKFGVGMAGNPPPQA
jgi:quercetin dioxygenase-like cupin family protein